MSWFSFVGWAFFIMCGLEVISTVLTIDRPPARTRRAMVTNAVVQIMVAAWAIAAIQRAV